MGVYSQPSERQEANSGLYITKSTFNVAQTGTGGTTSAPITSFGTPVCMVSTGVRSRKRSFGLIENGQPSQGGFMKRSVLNLFCAALFAATLAAGSAWADTVLHSFAGTPDGANPYGTPINDKYGNLYGTTLNGGAKGLGTVFVLCAPRAAGADIFPCTPPIAAWTEHVLYSFRGVASADGANPYSTLVFNSLYAGRDFTLYGTTFNGGGKGSDCDSSTGSVVGCGTVFELCAPSNFGGCGGVNAWTETVLHSFTAGTDGSHPFAGLITDKASDLFGTTVYGGSLGSCNGPSGGNEHCGTVFELKGSGLWTFPETIVHRFPGGTADGANPYGALCCNTIFAIPYFYGTTVNGGTGNAGAGEGVVYQVQNVAGFPETILYDLCTVPACADGANPYADVIFDSSGHLYSTTKYGGPGSGIGGTGGGIAFELTPAGPPWAETVLYSFLGGAGDGGNPTAGPLFDSSGHLYGTTLYGLACAALCGEVYKLTPAGPPWAETIRWTFLGTPDGEEPWGGVALDTPVSPTKQYGTTTIGGTSNNGTVYSQP
jgi:hypothetical protein